MTERSWTHMDKADWGDGPWQSEPDKLQWIDDATGYDCLIVRNRLGALCGYVGLPPEHPYHGVEHDQIDADVHGGLTFSDSCQEHDDPALGVCHVPLPGRPADVWWLGFDCAHMWDVLPGMAARERALGWPQLRDHGGTYKDVAYVRGEVAALAAVLAR